MAWVPPKPRKDRLRDEHLYVVEKQNEFFELLHKAPPAPSGFFATLLGTAESDKWALVLRNEDSWVVGLALSQAEADELWATVESFLAHPESKSSSREELMKDMEARFSKTGEVKEEKEGEGKTLSSLELFRTTFELPSEDLVGKFRAVYGLTPGMAYFSSHYFCFQASWGETKLVIPLVRIKALEKNGQLGIVFTYQLPDSKQTQELSFTFANQLEAFPMFRQLWDLQMDAVLARAESVMKTVEGGQRFNRTRHTRSDSNSPKVADKFSASNMKRNSSLRPVPRVSSKMDLSQVKLAQEFQRRFRLLSTINFTSMFPEVQLEMEHVEQEVLGDVFLHPQFFAFRDNSSRFSLLVLFRDVTNMTEQRSASLQVFTQTVHFRLHFGASKGGQQRDQLVAAWHSQPLHVGPTDLTEISMEFTLQSAANIRNLSSEPPLEYEVTQRRLELAWDRFWTSERPFGVPLLRALSLQNYMRQGVPDSKRGLLWQILSGSYALRLLLGTGYYKKLLDDNAETPSVAREEIDKDVHRSFPTHPYFQAGAPGPAALRRVLLAFAFHNETIGYCQSMNILAATFLLFMPEESVFFLLVSVCEVLMPGYYNRAMVGSLVDVNLFQDLLEDQLPEVSDHLHRLNVPVQALTMPWLLCLYIGYLPTEVSLKILDLFFFEGIDVLFRVGLAIFALKQQEILELKEGYAVMVMMKRALELDSRLIDLSFERFGDVSIVGLRLRKSRSHRTAMISNVESDARAAVLAELLKDPACRFNRLEVGAIYDWAVLTINDPDLFIPQSALPALLARFLPGWLALSKADADHDWLQPCLQVYLYDDAENMSFYRLVVFLSPLIKGTQPQRFKACVEVVFGGMECTQLGLQQLQRSLDLLVRLFGLEESALQPTLLFAQMLADRVNETPGVDQPMALARIEEELFARPMVNEFFGLPEQAPNTALAPTVTSPRISGVKS